MLKIKTKSIESYGLHCSSHGSKISNSPSNKSDKSRGWFTFKFIVNKNIQSERLNISVLKNLICLSENDWYLQIGVLLKYSIHSRTEFARVWPVRKWQLVQAVACRIYYGSLLWKELLKWSYFMNFSLQFQLLVFEFVLFRPN